MPDLTQVYGEHCKVEQVLVRAFGFERVFVRAGANAAWRGHPLAPPPAPKEAGVTAPPWAHEHPGDVRSVHAGCQTVTTWQQRMQDRGWEIDADGSYGADSEQVCRAFQREKGLHIDGVLGQDTWRAAWETPIT